MAARAPKKQWQVASADKGRRKGEGKRKERRTTQKERERERDLGQHSIAFKSILDKDNTAT